MKKILSAIILLSVFLIQIHGLFHSDIASHDNNHHCEICEIVSHNPSITPATLDLDFSFQAITVKSLTIFNALFVPRLVTLDSISPRAPPII